MNFFQKIIINQIDNIPGVLNISDDIIGFSKTKADHGESFTIPSTLQKRAIAIACEGHQGLVKTKQLLCENVLFPKIDDYIKH